MFDIKKDIQAMTTFRRNPGKFMEHLKKTKKPRFLQSMERRKRCAEAYQRLLDIAAHADAREGIRQGIEDVKEGAVPARESLKCSGATMPQLVRLTHRALWDMEAIYEFIEADASERSVRVVQ